MKWGSTYTCSLLLLLCCAIGMQSTAIQSSAILHGCLRCRNFVHNKWVILVQNILWFCGLEMPRFRISGCKQPTKWIICLASSGLTVWNSWETLIWQFPWRPGTSSLGGLGGWKMETWWLCRKEHRGIIYYLASSLLEVWYTKVCRQNEKHLF